MLKPGDQAALFCTGSRAIEPDHVPFTQAYLSEHYGLKIHYKEDTYRSLPAEARAHIFLDYLFNDEIKLLWAFRGGEGSADIIPYLEKEKEKIKALTPKLIMGLSDITAILIYFAQAYAWPVAHGPGASQIAYSKVDTKSNEMVRDFLFSTPQKIVLDDLKALNELTLENISGQLIGGNLSLLNISVKDIWEMKAKEKIVIIEDVNEKPHVISRTLKYLQRVGFFNGAKAIILGDFSFHNADEELKRQIQKVLNEFAKTCACPVFKSMQFGHEQQNHLLSFSDVLSIDSQSGKLIHR